MSDVLVERRHLDALERLVPLVKELMVSWPEVPGQACAPPPRLTIAIAQALMDIEQTRGEG